MVASSCNAAVRWHWDGVEALKEPDKKNPYPGRPMSLYKKLKIPELAEKLPQKCIPMGSKVGSLTLEAAEQLSLPEGLLVVQGVSINILICSPIRTNEIPFFVLVSPFF